MMTMTKLFNYIFGILLMAVACFDPQLNRDHFKQITLIALSLLILKNDL